MTLQTKYHTHYIVNLSISWMRNTPPLQILIIFSCHAIGIPPLHLWRRNICHPSEIVKSEWRFAGRTTVARNGMLAGILLCTHFNPCRLLMLASCRQNVLQIVDLCHILAEAVSITKAISMLDYDYYDILSWAK